MKKALIIVVIVLLMACICSCSASEPIVTMWTTVSKIDAELSTLDSLFMTVKEESITPSGAIFTIHNDSDRVFIYGQGYDIEKNIDGVWKRPEVLMAVDDVGYFLNAKSENVMEVDWEYYYEALSMVKYRLIKYLFENGTRGEPEFCIAAEFEIK